MNRPRTRSKATDTKEIIARGLGPILRHAIRELGPALCTRDPLGRPGWLIHLPDEHLCDVLVADDPVLHVSIRGYWVHVPTRRMIPLRPLMIPVDANKKAPVGGVVMFSVWVMYGRILGVDLRERARMNGRPVIGGRQHCDQEVDTASLTLGQDELVQT